MDCWLATSLNNFALSDDRQGSSQPKGVACCSVTQQTSQRDHHPRSQTQKRRARRQRVEAQWKVQLAETTSHQLASRSQKRRKNRTRNYLKNVELAIQQNIQPLKEKGTADEFRQEDDFVLDLASTWDMCFPDC